MSASDNHALYLNQRATIMQNWSDYLAICTDGEVVAGQFKRAA